MKSALLALSLLLSVAAGAAESPRTWTDAKGRKIEGTLVEKTDKTAVVLLKNAKRVTLKVAELSEADQEYITKAEVWPEPEMLARTVSLSSNEKKKSDYDIRKVQATLSKVHARDFEVTVFWLAPKSGKIAVYAKETKKLSADGSVDFEMEFKEWKLKEKPEYKGYVIGMRPAGTTIWTAVSASQKPFERFAYE
ncbi:hypothetical protein OKA04_23500 [Luteolibacter flavescens]|uniref:SLA1 homology domain-containing protein n=1 Tax=Luteolibacter flavescens TaxID=1859460 RepID=A0ABT3FVY3_9BACT|nr:hypothetical protein [Luteolibacter flavescens]MCW1887723.1 hypothetical protein [Luteolibacter flavescens]